MVKLTQEEFEKAIADALDSIPAQLLDAMENVVVLVQDEPEDVQQEFAAAGTEAENGDLLGLYEGTPLTQRLRLRQLLWRYSRHHHHFQRPPRAAFR